MESAFGPCRLHGARDDPLGRLLLVVEAVETEHPATMSRVQWSSPSFEVFGDMGQEEVVVIPYSAFFIVVHEN